MSTELHVFTDTPRWNGQLMPPDTEITITVAINPQPAPTSTRRQLTITVKGVPNQPEEYSYSIDRRLRVARTATLIEKCSSDAQLERLIARTVRECHKRLPSRKIARGVLIDLRWDD